MERLVKMILTESKKGELTEAKVPVELPNEDGSLRTVQVDAGPMIDFVFSNLTAAN